MKQLFLALRGAARNHNRTSSINSKFARQVIGQLLRIFKSALLRRVIGSNGRNVRGVPLHGAAHMHAIRGHAHVHKSIGVYLCLRGHKSKSLEERF